MRGVGRGSGGGEVLRSMGEVEGEGWDSSSIGEVVEGGVVLVSGWMVVVPIEDAVREGGEGCAIFAGWLA
jgi:hypothetical protein